MSQFEKNKYFATSFSCLKFGLFLTMMRNSMAASYNHINMRSFDLRIVLLNEGIRVKNLLHIKLSDFHTGLIKKFNKDLTFMLIIMQRRNVSLLRKENLTSNDYKNYRRKYMDKFLSLYNKMEKTHFLNCRETNEIADNILSELYRTEGRLRMKSFLPDYKPNDEIDKTVMKIASNISIKSATSLLTHHEI